jgi:SAM-dependent methyltransferase
MKMNQPSDPILRTIRYYDEHVAEYISDTSPLDMAALYQTLLQYVPKGGHILDVGCGPGRDTKVFLDLGYKVTAFDASTAMAAAASKFTGQQVKVMRVQDLDFEEQFDGVWACASLLHVPRAELSGVIDRITRAMKVGGVFYMSFKHGSGERTVGERFFDDQTEASLTEAIQLHRQLSIVMIWTSSDVRPGRDQEKWINAVARRSSLQH